MNAPASILTASGLPREPFDTACAAVNAWRGRCLDAFTRAELAATECLLMLAEVGDRGAAVKLPHLLGQRYEALAAATGPDAPFAIEGRAANAALTAFRTHEALRNVLCHGIGTIMLDRQGRWTVIFRTLALRARKAVRSSLVIEEGEAGRILEELTAHSRKLCSQLGSMRARITAEK